MRNTHSQFVLDLLWSSTQAFSWLAAKAQLAGQVTNRTAFGINVASAEDVRCDDYVVAKLRDLGLRHVRLHWGEHAAGTFTERFLRRLLDEGFDVLVVLVPDYDHAGKLGNSTAVQALWRQSVRTFLDAFAERVRVVEVGNAPNRPKWSGYSPAGYLQAWQIVHTEAQNFDVRLAGPNISDFEPFFNAAYLRAMARDVAPPDIQTDNLFVERAVQPEAYDASVLGRLLRPVSRFNLVKKINVLAKVARRHDVAATICSYACWTRPRLARWTAYPERKGADYLVRYLVIATATGQLERIYWGPLIDSRDGLIDCGRRDYPTVDNVAHYQTVRGRIDEFRVTASFSAFRFITALLRDARYPHAVCYHNRVSHVVAIDEAYEHHIVWAPDRAAFDLSALYPAGLESAQLRDMFGATLDERRCAIITERPICLSWPIDASPARPTRRDLRRLRPLGARGTLHDLTDATYPAPLDATGWRGVVSLDVARPAEDAAVFTPERITALPELGVLRDKRNRLWTVQSPTGDTTLVVKQNRATGARRLSYLFAKSKGQRHWNTAMEMSRQGICTPRPVAFMERTRWPGAMDNYYVSEHIREAFSARDVFTAFADGQAFYEGLSKADWLQHVARFVAHMHQRRIIHRDLSSGNMLFKRADGRPETYVIDIGRARIDATSGRTGDVKRMCYKLSWPDRKQFVAAYREAFPAEPLRYWRLACMGYDWKQRLKKALPRSRKRRR